MHTDPNQVLLYLEGKLADHERKAVEAHIAHCRRCATQFADLARLPRILDQPVPFEIGDTTFRTAVEIVARGKRRGFMFRLFAPPFRIALAGAAIVIIVVSTYLLLPRQEPSRFRSEEVEPSSNLTLFPSDGAVVHERRPIFRWTSIGTSSVYRFSLMDETGAIIWENDPRDTSVTLPGSLVLQSGKTYLWRVETFFADKTLDRSALHAFTYALQE
jgi:hypothetical protein